MSNAFSKLLKELAPTALELLQESLVDLATKDPALAQHEILDMAEQTALAVATRKAYRRT